MKLRNRTSLGAAALCALATFAVGCADTEETAPVEGTQKAAITSRGIAVNGCAGTALQVTVSNVATSTACVANYKQQFTIAATANTGGSVTAKNGATACAGNSCTVDVETPVALVAQPNTAAGYHFSGWLGPNCTPAANPTLTLTNVNTTCVASFALDTFTIAIRLVALILMAMAAVNLLTSLLTTTRESARRVGVEEAVGFTPHQLVGQGAISGAVLALVAVVVAVPVGLWLFQMLADLVSERIGVGPGWMPMPSPGTPTATSTGTISGSEPPGTPAVPTPASTDISTRAPAARD